MKFIALDVIVKNTALTESVTEWVLEPSKLFKQTNKKIGRHFLLLLFSDTHKLIHYLTDFIILKTINDFFIFIFFSKIGFIKEINKGMSIVLVS